MLDKSTPKMVNKDFKYKQQTLTLSFIFFILIHPIKLGHQHKNRTDLQIVHPTFFSINSFLETSTCTHYKNNGYRIPPYFAPLLIVINSVQ